MPVTGSPGELESPSTTRPHDSGVERAKSHDSGAATSTSAQPIPAHAARQPLAVTAAPTAGNAAMKPMLIATA